MYQRLREALGSGGFLILAAACLTAVAVAGWVLLVPAGTAPVTPEPIVRTEEPVSAALPAELPAEEPEPVAAPEPEPEPEPQPEPEPEPQPVPVVKAVSSVSVAPQAPSLVVSPLKGEVVAAFSVEELAYNATLGDWRIHDGIDIAAAAGTNVLAASAGTVLSVGEDELLGTTVVLGHSDGSRTTYANLQSKPPVREGDAVAAGQIIGAVGTTALIETAEGPHLHFSVSRDGDTVDPEEFLAR